MVSVMKEVLPSHRMLIQELQLAYHSVWKLTHEHICFKAHVLMTNPISYLSHINADLEKKPEIEQNLCVSMDEGGRSAELRVCLGKDK